jgi:hypothetical protein
MRTIGNYKLYYVSGEYSLLNSFSAWKGLNKNLTH